MTTPQNVLARLKAGNERFVADRLDGELQDSRRRRELTERQNPCAVILSCADSRVVPELAFDTGLGELFVVRIAGNVATSSSVASIEYAVAQLKTSVIVVLGHQSCGAVGAALEGGDKGYHLNYLLSHLVPAIAQVKDGTVDEVVKANAQMTVKALKERSSIIREALEEGRLQVVPAYYELDSGVVHFL